MGVSLTKKISSKLVNWLMAEHDVPDVPPCDFDRIRYEIRPCDVLLIEGQNRVSEIIKLVTQSAWSHAALYIGRKRDIEDLELRQKIEEHLPNDNDEQLLIESVLGKGTIISPLSNYQKDHIRICRPQGIARQDAGQVIRYAIDNLGVGYDMRNIFDLFRLLYPWSFLPRRWRSSLFTSHVNKQTQVICSSLLAEAFSSVRFPILPLVKKHKEKGIQLIQRNPRLFTPRDFDYSPYFEIIKYPIFELSERSLYRHLPWIDTEIENIENREAKKAFTVSASVPEDIPEPSTEPVVINKKSTTTDDDKKK